MGMRDQYTWLVWNALSCVGVVLAGYFGVVPRQESTRDQTQLKSYNSGVFVQIQIWTDQQVSRKKNKRCAIIQNELSLMSIYFVACNFKMIVAVDVLYNRLY